MKEELERAIQVLTKQIKEGVGPGDALQLSQAALNLANVLGGLSANKILS